MESLKELSKNSKDQQRQEYLQIIQDLKTEIINLKEKLGKTRTELGTEIVIMKEMIASLKDNLSEKDAKLARFE